MEGTGITPVMDVNRNYGYGDGFGFGGSSGLWLFAILALMWGGNGLFGGSNYGYRPATAEDVNNGFNFADLQDQNRDILTAIRQGTYDTSAAVERVGTALNNEIHDVQMVAYQNQAIEQQCCCNTLRAIDSVNYNGAMNTAAIKEAILLDGQKTRELITTNKIEALQDKVNKLELAQAVAGVVRYPTSSAYNAGANPFCACGCGYSNGNI